MRLIKVICLYSCYSPFYRQIGTMTDSCHSAGNSFLFQIKLICLWISEWTVLPPALISSAGIWSIFSDLWLYSFSIAILTSKALSSGTSGSAVCVFLPNITNPMYIEQVREMVPPPTQNTVGVCNQITLYYISFRLVSLLNTLRTGDADLRF